MLCSWQCLVRHVAEILKQLSQACKLRLDSSKASGVGPGTGGCGVRVCLEIGAVVIDTHTADVRRVNGCELGG